MARLKRTQMEADARREAAAMKQPPPAKAPKSPADQANSYALKAVLETVSDQAAAEAWKRAQATPNPALRAYLEGKTPQSCPAIWGQAVNGSLWRAVRDAKLAELRAIEAGAPNQQLKLA